MTGPAAPSPPDTATWVVASLESATELALHRPSATLERLSAASTSAGRAWTVSSLFGALDEQAQGRPVVVVHERERAQPPDPAAAALSVTVAAAIRLGHQRGWRRVATALPPLARSEVSAAVWHDLPGASVDQARDAVATTAQDTWVAAWLPRARELGGLGGLPVPVGLRVVTALTRDGALVVLGPACAIARAFRRRRAAPGDRARLAGTDPLRSLGFPFGPDRHLVLAEGRPGNGDWLRAALAAGGRSDAPASTPTTPACARWFRSRRAAQLVSLPRVGEP